MINFNIEKIVPLCAEFGIEIDEKIADFIYDVTFNFEETKEKIFETYDFDVVIFFARELTYKAESQS